MIENHFWTNNLIRKTTASQEDDYATSCLLYYTYFKKAISPFD